MTKILSLCFILLLAACSSVTEERPLVEVRTLEVPRQEPIVPTVDPLTLRPVEWIVVTQSNISEFIENMTLTNSYFVLTVEGYENLSLNLIDIRSLVEQQNVIIAVYRDSFR